ncbi:hypothetical protein [Foetidibacter luteolus]|uniref:hypothetical protein n=1 Tax=Foetidibacter luteolus TaxID=2608880 RepID=UPI00129A550E|nr:hypothetical protein [Foetidibacter luteolus]
MKQLLVIILSMSLYAPSVARILAFAECLAAASPGTEEFCDCIGASNSHHTPSSHSLPDKQKEITLKTDWKYTGTAALESIACPVVALCCNHIKPACDKLPHSFLYGIFHPPRIV